MAKDFEMTVRPVSHSCRYETRKKTGAQIEVQGERIFLTLVEDGEYVGSIEMKKERAVKWLTRCALLVLDGKLR
jgi:hypothetical protein